MKLKKIALRGMIALAVVIALCILFSGTIRTLTTPKVRYASVRNGKFETVTELTGKVFFPKEENITVEIPEGQTLTVLSVLATPGQQVRRGDKLLTMEVTGAEKTLASLQQEYDAAQSTLDAWERKNGGIRLSRNETLWKEAYEASRAADRTEREARLELMTQLEAMEISKLPETLPEGADAETTAAWDKWQEAEKQRTSARNHLSSLDRYAIADDVWNLLQQKQEAEKKREDAENQMIAIGLLSRRTAVVTAPHNGYIVSVTATKGGTVSAGDVLLRITPEDQNPVIRADISAIKQNISKGTAIQINSDSWGRVDTRVINTGLSDTGHPFADAEITEDVIWALGQVSAIMKEENIKMSLTTRAQESTCLVPAAAIRGSGSGRYVYVAEQESSTFGGKSIKVRKYDVTVLAESSSLVSVAEDLTYNKVVYMEDRALEEGMSVMMYEE